jgi:hypothetical protein
MGCECCCRQLRKRAACMGIYQEAAGEAVFTYCFLSSSLRAKLHDETLQDLQRVI